VGVEHDGAEGGCDDGDEEEKEGLSLAQLRAMSTRLFLYIACAVIAALAIPLMFGLLPPNPNIGIRIAATKSDPATWYLVHGILGWMIFFCAAGLSYWLWRHPNAARPSPLTLALLAMAVLVGLISG
jgi:hypothetical protein